MKTWLAPSSVERNHQHDLSTVLIQQHDLKESCVLVEGLTGLISQARWIQKDVVTTQYYSDQHYQSFRRAALELCTLNHPNILQVYGICDELHCSITEVRACNPKFPPVCVCVCVCAMSDRGVLVCMPRNAAGVSRRSQAHFDRAIKLLWRRVLVAILALDRTRNRRGHEVPA
jgi:hypothetical protein